MARFTVEECGQTYRDVNADQNSLMKQFALGVKVGHTKSKRIVLKPFGVYACIISQQKGLERPFKRIFWGCTGCVYYLHTD